ncbi:putative gustatory receptor 2a, partial [Condylostylus longicornis]|uniref:putative gustatory receptor 2a n=1 Tax=Condylostylus longicornis TaxID=2530218 RepID=UPI00244DDDE8
FVKNVFEDSKLSSLVSGLVFVSQSVAHITTIIQSILTKEKQFQIFTSYNEIDNDFKTKLNRTVNLRNIRVHLLNKISIILTILILNMLILINFIIGTNFNTVYWYSFFTVQSLRLRVIQCFSYIILVNERFDILNEILLNFIKEQYNYKKRIFTIDSVNSLIENNNNMKSNKNIETILALKHIYNGLWDTVNLINECFGWSLLSIITSYFLDFTSNAYWLFMAIENMAEPETIWKCLGTMLPLILIIGYLSWGCQECSNKGERTGNLVNKLEKSNENEKYNALISEFSLQIIHEPISITANGFFNINFNLLGSMAAATVTYLVILIQFLLSERTM